MSQQVGHASARHTYLHSEGGRAGTKVRAAGMDVISRKEADENTGDCLLDSGSPGVESCSPWIHVRGSIMRLGEFVFTLLASLTFFFHALVCTHQIAFSLLGNVWMEVPVALAFRHRGQCSNSHRTGEILFNGLRS